jgi:hypothetical protein
MLVGLSNHLVGVDPIHGPQRVLQRFGKLLQSVASCHQVSQGNYISLLITFNRLTLAGLCEYSDPFLHVTSVESRVESEGRVTERLCYPLHLAKLAHTACGSIEEVELIELLADLEAFLCYFEVAER